MSLRDRLRNRLPPQWHVHTLLSHFRIFIVHLTVLDHDIAVEFCLSIKCVHPDKTKDSSAYILIPDERLIHLVLRHEEWVWGCSLLPDI